MRHLINAYVQADTSLVLGDLDELTLTELIVATGIHDAIAKKLNPKGKLSNTSVAEGIINNLRKTIIRDHLSDPKFYDEMSKLLEDLIKQKSEDTQTFKAFLSKAQDIAVKLVRHTSDSTLPTELSGKPVLGTIYRNLPEHLQPEVDTFAVNEPTATFGDPRVHLTLQIDKAMHEQAPADWRGDDAKERMVQNTLFSILHKDRAATQKMFELLKAQADYR